MPNFKQYTINIKGTLKVIERTWVMGILNVTPDSFYSGSRCDAETKIVNRIHQLVEEKADIIDIGGYSSRPHADDISADEEFKRLKCGLEHIRREAPDAIVSIDTFRAGVARRCVEEYGADIINDISGGDMDRDMYSTIASLKVPYVMMHMRGTPETMTSLTDYDNVVTDVIKSLGVKIDALRELGVNDIIIDPGFGFSKTVAQNFELLSQLEEFTYLNLPLLVGVSRKSMIYKSLNITAEESLNGTTVLNTIAVERGAHILRVHDVKAATEAVKLVSLTLKR